MGETRTFADCAPELWQAGWAPIPVDGRRPLVSGYPDWRSRLPMDAVERWAKNRPDADIAIVAGLCETGRGPRGTIIVDYDDPSALGKLEEAIGRHYTPCQALSRRGEHHTYAAFDEDGDPIDLRHFTTLRHYGINVDVKHSGDGKGVVIMPQSVHVKDRSVRYRWKEGSGPEALKDAPPFPIKALHDFLDKQSEKSGGIKDKPLRDDSRAQGLNDYLVSQVAFCECREGLLDVAETWNDTVPEKQGKLPLDHDEVEDRVDVVWRQHLEKPFIKMLGSSGYAHISDEESDMLQEANPKINALPLLVKFRVKHSYRCARGETFVICPFAMARDQVIPRWTRERYENARDLLIETGRRTG